jgi:endonuclease VIII
MPEGDTIFRAARTLNRALADRKVTRFESVLPALTRIHEDASLTGRTIVSVTAAGKHILMRFSALDGSRADPELVEGSPLDAARGDLVLRTHMRMNGSWHIYRPGERWRMPRRDMRVVVATDAFEAVGFNIPVAEFLQGRAIARQPDLRLMGPDLLGETFDEAEAIRRLRERNEMEIADALLNQRVVAGIGNIYKSEVLFLCRVNPWTRVGELSDEHLRDILATARTHLKANVVDRGAAIVTYRGGGRRTRASVNPAHGLYVYGRAGDPCRRCGAPIAVTPQGPYARLTYRCPACQP